MPFWKRSKPNEPAPPLKADPPAPPPEPLKPTWPPILGKVSTHPGGQTLALATPTADVWIQGVPCRAQVMVTFHRNGRLESAELARAQVVEGESLPANATVVFEGNGRLRSWTATFPEDRTFTAKGAGAEQDVPFAIPAGSEIVFEWGKLREVRLAAEASFDGYRFPADTEVIFGDSGSLSHVTASEPIELRGICWSGHEAVVFEFGRLSEGWPEGDGRIDGVPYQAGEIVRLHDNGRLARCYLSHDTVLSGVCCQAGTRVYLDDAGNLLEGVLAADTVLAGVPVAAGSPVGLEDGRPTALIPREDFMLDGIHCAAKKLVELTTEGRLYRATLASEKNIGDWGLPKGSVFVLEKGNLRKVVATDAKTPDGRVLEARWRIDFEVDGAIRHLLPVSDDDLGDSLTLREATQLNGVWAKAGTAVELDSDGRVASLVLDRDQAVGGWTGKASTRVHLYPNGVVSHLYAAAEVKIDGVPCAAAQTLGVVINEIERTYREQIRFHEEGSLELATLASDAVVAGVPLARGNTVARYRGGALQLGTLSTRWTHPLGCVAERNTLLGLFEDGSPSQLTLAEPFTFAGRAHQAGTTLRFMSPGILESVDAGQVPLGECEPVQ